MRRAELNERPTVERPNGRSVPIASTLACPFGCDAENGQVDERGLCDHLIGITCAAPPDKIDDGFVYYHPIKRRRLPTGPNGTWVDTDYVFLDGQTCLPVAPDDQLVPITGSSRVYRLHARQRDSKGPEPVPADAKTRTNSVTHTEKERSK